MTKLLKYNSKKTAERYFKDDNTGNILLPNFQRKFVWTPDQQKKLIASALAGVPIGSVLLLKSEKTDMAVRQLCFNDMKINPDKNASREYLLDGQQRFSSLKNAFTDVCQAPDNWKTQDRGELKQDLPENLQIRWFLDIEDGDFDLQNASFEERKDISPTHYIGKLHYTAGEKYWLGEKHDEELKGYCVKESRIPLWKLSEWGFICDILKQIQHVNNSDIADEVRENWAHNVYQHLKSRTLGTIVPNIAIDQSAMEIAIGVFEQVNTSGTKLSILDILAAKMAEKEKTPLLDLMEEFLLEKRNYFGERKWAPLELPDAQQKFWSKETPAGRFQKAYVNCLAIACYIKNNPNDPKAQKFKNQNLKQTSLYKLKGETIHECWKKTLENLLCAYAFLVDRCGVVTFNDIKFQFMILPIFTAIHAIDRSRLGNNEGKFFDRLEYWYWRALFDGKYREKQNARVIDDIQSICNFCESGKDVEAFQFDEDNKHLMQLPDFSDFDAVSLIGKGVNAQLTEPMLQFMLSRRPYDLEKEDQELTTWEMLEGKKIQRDHILPIRKRRSDKKDRFHSALMQTFLLKETNLGKSDNTHNLQKYFKDSTRRHQHFIPDNIEEIGQEFDKCEKDKACENKIAEKFMKARHQRFQELLKHHLKELKRSFKS